MNEVGITNRILSQTENTNENVYYNSFVPVNFYGFLFPSVILLIGILLASVILIFELIFFWNSKKKK